MHSFFFPLVYKSHQSYMVSVLEPSVVDRGFEHREFQTTDYKIKICVASLLSTHH